MSDEPQGASGPKIDAWQNYFQAAITGMLAAGQVDPRGDGAPQIVAEACAKIADAAVQQDALRRV